MRPSVLIVDDEFGLAEATAEILRERGYEVRIAINGVHGLAGLAPGHVDLVIVDLVMPIMDGPEMIRQMRADPALAGIPAILITARPDAIPTSSRALHDAVLVKPFRLAELMRTVDLLLGMPRTITPSLLPKH